MAGRGKGPMSRTVGPQQHQVSQSQRNTSSLGTQQWQESQSQRSTPSIPGSLPNQSYHTTSSRPSHLQIPRRTTVTRDVEMQTDSPHTQEGGISRNESEPTTPVSSTASTNLPELWVEDGHFMPEDLGPTKAITDLIRAKWDGVWPTYCDVPLEDKNILRNEFESKYNIPPQYLNAARKRFNRKMSDRVSDSLSEARKQYARDESKPDWIKLEVWTELLNYWNGEYFQNRSQVNKANRNRITEDGRPVAKHTGGSISAQDTRTRMADHDAEMKRILEEQSRFAQIIEETVAARAAAIEQRALARAAEIEQRALARAADEQRALARAAEIEQRAMEAEQRAAASRAVVARMMAHFSKIDPSFTSSGVGRESS